MSTLCLVLVQCCAIAVSPWNFNAVASVLYRVRYFFFVLYKSDLIFYTATKNGMLGFALLIGYAVDTLVLGEVEIVVARRAA